LRILRKSEKNLSENLKIYEIFSFIFSHIFSEISKFSEKSCNFPGMPNVYQFAASQQGDNDARQFLGHVQALCPGQRVVMFRTTVLPDIL
jgi:hypothetical protein